MRNQVSSNFNKRNDFRRSGKLRGHGGFTLAELLIVIAIILILAGFGFVNVIENQRRLHLREMDDTARQIFIAAQNHLTVAEASGQWDYEKLKNKKGFSFGTSLDEDEDIPNYPWLKYEPEKYYYVTKNDLNSDSALKYILPFGAIDDTIRNGAGQYIILYDAKSATINGVFYTDNSETPLTIGAADGLYYTYIKDGDNNRRARQTQITRRTVVGWYGPGKAEGVDDSGLKRPIVTVENLEALSLNIVDPNNKFVTNPNADESKQIKLVFKGKTAGTAEFIVPIDTTVKPDGVLNSSKFAKNIPSDSPLKDKLDHLWTGKMNDNNWYYKIYLDSINVPGGHFAEIFESSGFIAGDDITISVSVIFNGKESKATEVTTNSLFGSVSESNAMVLNGRHLQNLDSEISNVGKAASKPVAITGADIRSDIAWRNGEDNKDFENNYKNIGNTETDDFSLYTGSGIKAVQVYKYNNNSKQEPEHKPEHKFYSIENATLKTVKGNENTLSNFDIVENDTDKNAGLFGSFTDADSEISDLKLKNFTVTGTGSAGTLCGSSKDTAITKVLAYHEAQTSSTYNPGKDSLITGKVSGGLVGTMDGGKIEQSAAAVFVKATDNAGGLVGTCTGTVHITDSYAGGHTAGSAVSDIDKIGYYEDSTDEAKRGHYNVISTGGSAGGLIGSYAGGMINRCYSTASASGASAAGGLIGTAAGTVAANNSYCTGRVGGSAVDAKKGQFIGNGTLTSGTGNLYFSIVNNDMKAIGGFNTDPTGLTALDANLTTYNDFVSIGKTGTAVADAKPYDGGLTTLYGGKYALKTISQLGGPSPTPTRPDTIPEWLTTHYGDWPAPETLVVNVPAGS